MLFGVGFAQFAQNGNRSDGVELGQIWVTSKQRPAAASGLYDWLYRT